MARDPRIDEYLLNKKPGLLRFNFKRGLGMGDESPDFPLAEDEEAAPIGPPGAADYVREKKPGLLGEQFNMSPSGLGPGGDEIAAALGQAPSVPQATFPAQMPAYGGGLPAFARGEDQPEVIRSFMASLAPSDSAPSGSPQDSGGAYASVPQRQPLRNLSAPPMVQAPDEEEDSLKAQLARFDELQGQQRGEDSRAGFLSGMSKIGASIAGQNNAIDFKGRNLLGSEKERQALIKQYLSDKYTRGKEERADKRLDQEAGYKEALTRQALAQAERAGRPTVDPYESRQKLQDDEQANRLRMQELEIQARSGDLDKRLASQRELAARRADAAAAAALKKGEKKGEKESKGRDLPAGEAATLGKLGVADSMLQDLDKAWGSGAGMTAFVSKHLPGTEATKYGDIQRATAQVVGTIMEGGKLTDADLPKYMALLPNPDDSKDRAKAKVAMLRRMLEQQRAGSLAGFESAGFNVGGFNRQPVSGADLNKPSEPQASALPSDKAARLEELRKKKAAGRLGT